MGNGIFRQIGDNPMSEVGIGYIVIPDGEDRDNYIGTCFRRERVDIYIEGGDVVRGCYIDKFTLQSIYFPDYKQLGSAVIFTVPKFFDVPIVIGSLSKADETQLLEENSFKHSVSFQDNVVSIIGKGKTGELFINVESEYNDEGNIFITVRNKNNSSKFNLKCFGDVNIYSEGNTILKTLNDVELRSVKIDNGSEELNAKVVANADGFYLEDAKGNIIQSTGDGNINVIPTDRCNLFEGNSPLVKGDELKSQLEKMKDRIDKIIQALDAGNAIATGSTKVYSTAVNAVLGTIESKEDFDNINSEKSFTD